jgi:hypothetical protein
MTQLDETLLLEKTIWTNDDFKIMGWHDAQIHAFAFDNNSKSRTGDLLLDIDYIFKWIHPKVDGGYFYFWVAPCTLTFKNAIDLDINFQTNAYETNAQEIDELTLTKEKSKHSDIELNRWTIQLRTGYISFVSEGFTQIVRQKPILTGSQQLRHEERNGISFNRQHC